MEDSKDEKEKGWMARKILEKLFTSKDKEPGEGPGGLLERQKELADSADPGKWKSPTPTVPYTRQYPPGSEGSLPEGGKDPSFKKAVNKRKEKE